MKTVLFIFVALSLNTLCFAQKIKSNSIMIVNNPIIFELIPDDAQVEILGEGFEWTEGPLWLSSENKLLFSDVFSNSIYEWTEQNGTKIYLKPSGYTGNKKRGAELGSNGLLLSLKSELVICQHGDRRVVKMNADLKNPKPVFNVLANNYNGKKLNSPNDAAYRKNGELYFTDPPYGLEHNMDDPAKELDFQGVYKVDNSGKIILLTSEISRPNGIAFSPDEKKLYVASSDSLKAIWMVYDVAENGLLENGKVFFDATSRTKEFRGLPDGMKVHPNGWIFAAGPGGILIFTPEGELLGTIITGERTSNCAFNDDFSALYITADNYLLRLKLKNQ